MKKRLTDVDPEIKLVRGFGIINFYEYEGVGCWRTTLQDAQGRYKMADIMTRKIIETAMLMGCKKKTTVSCGSSVHNEGKGIQSKWHARAYRIVVS